MSEASQARFVRKLADDLASGAWERRFGHWRRKPCFEGSLPLLTSDARG